MPGEVDLSSLDNNALINELLDRESFYGVIVVAAVCPNGQRDSVAPYFSRTLDDDPTWRRRSLLEKAEQFIGHAPPLE